MMNGNPDPERQRLISEKLFRALVDFAATSERLVTDVTHLVEESDGIYGLHLNGDQAPWEELLAGGAYEEWLSSLDDARRKLKRLEELRGGSWDDEIYGAKS